MAAVEHSRSGIRQAIDAVFAFPNIRAAIGAILFARRSNPPVCWVLIVGEVREGRFTGTKREAGFPQNAGIFCQREAWPPHHRAYIGFGDKPLMKFSVRRVRHIP